MTTQLFNDVGDFHEKFDLPFVRNFPIDNPDGSTTYGDDAPAGPIKRSAKKLNELLEFRTKFLDEELDEFKKGIAEGDIAQQADALVDLVYVALGTAHMLGLPWDQLWDDVQRANMTKERAAADGSNSKRGSDLDVIKPAGWVGPDTVGILLTHGFTVITTAYEDPDNHTSTEGVSQ